MFSSLAKSVSSSIPADIAVFNIQMSPSYKDGEDKVISNNHTAIRGVQESM
jgi:hypothetical protein